jgi:hypothetical protein
MVCAIHTPGEISWAGENSTGSWATATLAVIIITKTTAKSFRTLISFSLLFSKSS